MPKHNTALIARWGQNNGCFAGELTMKRRKMQSVARTEPRVIEITFLSCTHNDVA
jgi:hypothetical protein